MTTGLEEYDFVEHPSSDFFCLVTFSVLCEPYQTRCCGNHLSQESYRKLQGQPCPVCKKDNLLAMDDKFHKRRVLSLKVRCPHKAEGCEWEGELGSLEQHLSTNSSNGECGYVDVDCPYSCGEVVKKRDLEEHKSQHCPLRPFTCQYCNHEATYQEVTKEYWPVCEKYPLPCPNECGEEEIERQHLKRHLQQNCPLEVIQCLFSYAGGGAKLQRRLMSAHLNENTELHFSMVAQIQNEVSKFKFVVEQQEGQLKQQKTEIKQLKNQVNQHKENVTSQIKQQTRVLKDQMKQQEDQLRQQGNFLKQQADQIWQLTSQIKQQGDQIKQQEDTIKQQGDVIKHQIDQLRQPASWTDTVAKLLGDVMTPPVQVIMDGFLMYQCTGNVWFSPPFYSHVGGYKLCLGVVANGCGIGSGTHMSMHVHVMKGEFDRHLKWPFSGDVTVMLMRIWNATPALGIQRTVNFRSVRRVVTMNEQLPAVGYDQFIPLADLKHGYLHRNSLVFHVREVVQIL